MDIVSAQQYAGYDGFGVAPFADVEALHKALTAGSGTDASLFTGGRSLIVESLEQTLMTTTFSMDDIVLFRDLKTNPIFAIVDEWTEKSSYGSRYGVSVGEAENPGARDSTYNRKTGQVKFYRVQREISHVMTLTKGIIDAEAEEQIDGTMLLVQAIEEALFYGNSSIISEEIDGLKRIIATNGDPSNIIDVRGPISESLLQQGARVIRNFFGIPTDLYMSMSNQTDIDRILENKHRVAIPLIGENGGLTAGAPIEKYRTSFGTFNLKPDVFITEEKLAPVAAIGTAPAAPTSIAAVSGAQSGSKFTASDAGTYFYVISYFTKSGESAGTALASAVTVASGDGVTLTMNGGTTGTVKGAKIYRSAKNAADSTDCLLIATVAFTGSGQTYIDLNADLPGASDMFLLNMSPNHRAISWQQFLPLMKLPLAITAPSIPFLLMLYGYLRVTKPKQNVIFKNVRPSDHRFNV